MSVILLALLSRGSWVRLPPDAPLRSLALKYIVRMYFRAFFVGLHFFFKLDVGAGSALILMGLMRILLLRKDRDNI